MNEGEQHSLIDDLTASASFPLGNVTTLDGVRVDYPDGFGLARASNTTPTLIFRFEADTEEALNRIKEEFRFNIGSIRSNLELPY